MKTHQERFNDARFAASSGDNTQAETIQHLVTAIWELGFINSDLHNVAHNAHNRLEFEQKRIVALEDEVRRIPRGGPPA